MIHRRGKSAQTRHLIQETGNHKNEGEQNNDEALER